MLSSEENIPVIEEQSEEEVVETPTPVIEETSETEEEETVEIVEEKELPKTDAEEIMASIKAATQEKAAKGFELPPIEEKAPVSEPEFEFPKIESPVFDNNQEQVTPTKVETTIQEEIQKVLIAEPSPTKFCDNCGIMLTEYTSICPSCGEPID